MPNLTVTTKESITMQGKQMGSARTMTFPNIVDVYTRVFSFKQQVATSLYTTHADTVSAGVFDDGSVKYARITSLGKEPLVIEIVAEGPLVSCVELQQGQSYYLYSHTLSSFAEGDALETADYTALKDIIQVKAYCPRGAGRVEVFIASTEATK
mgnify:FL=1|tara:strand:- start:2881 stop:3342 length:462 start_codon:yes stop_codon:yes gene_type:complete